MGEEPTPSPVRHVSAAVYRRKGEVEVEHGRPLPAPGPGEVVVEVAFCGVCGSDLHLIVEGWGTPGDVLGHEWTGRVVEVGPDVGSLGPGDAVLVVDEPACGSCDACRAGRPSQCEHRAPMTGEFDGAFATHVLARVAQLRRVPDGMSLRTAALAEPLAVALHAITRAELDDRSSVLVSGAGPIGALAVAALRRAGHDVVVSEPAETRRALAEGLGARVVVPGDLATFDMTQVDTAADPSYHAVIETSGRRRAMEAGIQQLRRGGRMVLVGTGMERPSFDPNRMIVMELSVRGSFVYDADGFDRALELLAEPGFPVDLLVEEAEYDLAGVGEAAERLAAAEHAGKVMIVPNRAPTGRTRPSEEEP